MFTADRKLMMSMEKWLKKSAVIIFLMMERCAPLDIHQRMTAVYGGACMDVSAGRIWAKIVKD